MSGCCTQSDSQRPGDRDTHTSGSIRHDDSRVPGGAEPSPRESTARAGAIAVVVTADKLTTGGCRLLRLTGRVPRYQGILSGRGLAFATDTLGLG